MSFLKRPATAPASPMAGDGTEDSVLGTIVLLWFVLIVACAEAIRELITPGTDGDPFFGILGLAGIPFLGALLALALGSTHKDRLVRGATVAAGFGLITLGVLADAKFNMSGLGRGLDAAGAVVIVHFLFGEARRRRGLPVGRFTTAASVMFGIWTAYAAATLAVAGSIHLAVAGLLVWQVARPIADAYAKLREKMGSVAAPSEFLEEFVPVEVYSRFTPEQQEIVDGVTDFIAATYENKWPNPTIREAVDAPAFTTYVLDKPDVVDAGKFLSQVDNLAIKLGVSEQVGSSRVDLQACKLEYSIVSPK